jgi:hypothetical protein
LNPFGFPGAGPTVLQKPVELWKTLFDVPAMSATASQFGGAGNLRQRCTARQVTAGIESAKRSDNASTHFSLQQESDFKALSLVHAASSNARLPLQKSAVLCYGEDEANFRQSEVNVINDNISPGTGTSTRTTGTSKLAILAAFVAGAAAAWLLITVNSEPIEPAVSTTVVR